ncbi:MAG: WXG100 family type VII secretion target [Lachnospiraceae bacterium]|nr:WXG100 family type VII secretion target [Lachnospiraceae bacterium]
MDSIKVTYDELTIAARNVDTKADEYYSTYTALLQEVDSLTSSGWTGTDADAFREQVNGFSDDFEKMKSLMNEYATFLRNAAQNYKDTQNSLSTQIKNLQN